MKMFSRYIVGTALTACLLLWAAMPITGQSGAKNGEWRTYGGDLGNTHYSPLDQINADNFYKLQVAWRFKTDNLGPGPEFNLESTPLMANGVVYSTAGTRRAVVASDTDRVGDAQRPCGVPKSKKNVKGYVRGLDVRTGKRLWIFHTIPLPSEYGYEAWENGSAEYTGNTGVWGQISVDEELGMVYLPVALPTGGCDRGPRTG